MATVLEFPTIDVKRRQRREKLVWGILESHDPENREEKHRMVMEELDRITHPDISITMTIPPGEPFTKNQLAAVSDGMQQLRDECERQGWIYLREVILLKLQIIDL